MAKTYAGVRSKSDTTIEINFNYQGKRYYETLKLEPNARNLQIAHDFRTEILIAIRKGTFDYSVSFPDSKHAKNFKPHTNTIADYLQKTYLPRFEKYAKARTIKEYRNTINLRLIPVFGHLQLHELTIPLVKEWIDTLDLAPKTVRNYLSPLRSALNEAVEDGLITHNPLATYSPKLRTNQVKEENIDPITYEEEKELLNVAEPQFKNLLQFALWTGLRPQEYLALKWEDIDFIHNTARINKAKSDFVAVETTKTKSSIRTLDLLPPAIEALKRQKAITFLHDKEIFLHKGKIYHGVSYMKRIDWDKTFKKAGVRMRTPKQTRHTFASRMLSAGEPLLWVSKYLGHASASMTLNAYARYMPSEQNQAGSKALEQAKNHQ